MKTLSFVLGLGAVFAAASALAEPKVNEKLCIVTLEPEAHLTQCEYRLPAVLEYKLDSGRTLKFNGARSFKGDPMPGLDPKMCESHFEETQKIHGPCRKITW